MLPFFLQAVKLKNPDFVHQASDAAVADFKKRLTLYEKVYEPLDLETDRDLSFVTLYNVGSKFVANGIQGVFSVVVSSRMHDWI